MIVYANSFDDRIEQKKIFVKVQFTSNSCVRVCMFYGQR